ncbi:hypothetical protein [Streptomyces sp. ML-6]|uniref:hypothetical protein n=1 Tax=Streptomyces sp. ML-6 TaxID=2982693 RepID=UPI0024C055BA|nr:hypothetical protein [Streptomyces sp. ML-6]MDK0524429.1 hypothetical protein [Streptomyces sp. ML-6]
MSAAVVVGVALVACACGPEEARDDTGAKPEKSSQQSASARAEEPSAEPSASAPAAPSEKPPTGGPSVPRTKEGAIQRYEQYLRAVGREDIDTVCEVAGPAAKQAEDQGFGPCTSTFLVTFRLFSPTQKKALRTATVDPQRVSMVTPDKFEMPADSVRSSVVFSDGDIGSSTLEYLKGNWYITD